MVHSLKFDKHFIISSMSAGDDDDDDEDLVQKHVAV